MSIDRHDLKNLLERLQAADGPDREIDFWISVWVNDPTDETDEALHADIDLVGIEEMCIDAPYTASLDASIELVEKVLPNARIKAWIYPGLSGFEIWKPHGMSGRHLGMHERGDEYTALALLTAMTKALIAEQE